MNINFHHAPDKDHVQNQAVQALQNQLAEYAKKEFDVLLFLSGGSSIDLLNLIEPKVLSPKLALTVLDERFSFDPQINNWLQITHTSFYQQAMAVGCGVIETVPEPEESLEAFAQRWEKNLRAWIQKHPRRRTIATIGIGADGHVAGISPFPKTPERFVDFYFTDTWVKGYVGNLEPPERLTVTAKFMEQKIDYGMVYAVGESKRPALEKVMANEGRMADTPARILREMKQVEVFTDIKISDTTSK